MTMGLDGTEVQEILQEKIIHYAAMWNKSSPNMASSSPFSECFRDLRFVGN